MNRLEFTDDASGGHFTDAESLDEYVDLALNSPSSYNQGERGVSTLVRVTYRYAGDDTSTRHGWIDFARDVDAAEALRILRKNDDGMQIDWTHDAGRVNLSPAFDADTTDAEIRKAVEDADPVPEICYEEYAAPEDAAMKINRYGKPIWYLEGAIDRDDAFYYWSGARDAAREQRELVSEAIDLLEGARMTTYGQHHDAPAAWDSGKLPKARELVGQIADLESEFGDSPTYGPALSALDPDEAVPAKAPTAAELARETLRGQAQSRSR